MIEIFLCICAAFVTFNIWRCVEHLENIEYSLSSIKNNGEEGVEHLEVIADALVSIESRGSDKDEENGG